MTASVAIVGSGTIGAGWAALCLLHGDDVLVIDPSPGAEEGLRRRVDRITALLLQSSASPQRESGTLTFAPSLPSDLSSITFVQECVPEIAALKADVIQELDGVLGPGVVIASSASFLLPSQLQAGCRHPGRVLVGHPFNPCYLLPLVEVVPGAQTDATAVESATAFYLRIGKRPITVHREVSGFIANRLQAAVNREIVDLVNTGVASAEDIDAAFRFALAPRWSVVGPSLGRYLIRDASLDDLVGVMPDEINNVGLSSADVAWEPEGRDRFIAGILAETGGKERGALVSARDDQLLRVLEVSTH